MMKLYHDVSTACSKLITRRYSTSFSLGIRVFEKSLRNPIYSIYGFVRLADEIVDTFHDFPKAELLRRFRKDTELALHERISYNPVLHAFQQVVHAYGIDRDLVDAFLDSMEMDLYESAYNPDTYEQYIYGSAEVVGLMCLKVFTKGDAEEYERLKEPARKLGAAFQKINFLRDIQSDHDDRGRVYFPGVNFSNFDNAQKRSIELDIQADFDAALLGIKNLPSGARLGVYLAYKYYTQLFKKIKKAPACCITRERFRVSDKRKMYLLFSSAVRCRVGLL